MMTQTIGIEKLLDVRDKLDQAAKYCALCYTTTNSKRATSIISRQKSTFDRKHTTGTRSMQRQQQRTGPWDMKSAMQKSTFRHVRCYKMHADVVQGFERLRNKQQNWLPVNSSHSEVVTQWTPHIMNSLQRLPQNSELVTQWTRHRGCLISQAWSQSNSGHQVTMSEPWGSHSLQPQAQQSNLSNLEICKAPLNTTAFSNVVRYGNRQFYLQTRQSCLYSPATEHHRPLAGTHFTVPQKVEGWVDLDGWLHTEAVRPQESNPDPLVSWEGGHPILTLHSLGASILVPSMLATWRLRCE